MVVGQTTHISQHHSCLTILYPSSPKKLQQDCLKGLHSDESLDQHLPRATDFAPTYASELLAPDQMFVNYSTISYY
jgi:hypothetical protein